MANAPKTTPPQSDPASRQRNRNRVLKLGGDIHIASNMADYLSEAAIMLETYWNYRVVCFGPRDGTSPTRTIFEAKYLRQGHTIFDLQLEKTAPPCQIHDVSINRPLGISKIISNFK